VPRNVVTVMRRRSLLRPRARRELQTAVLTELSRRRTVRWRPRADGVEVDFPKRLGEREAKQRVLDDLAAIDPDWQRLFVVYPR
jgi:hypothetical protein